MQNPLESFLLNLAEKIQTEKEYRDIVSNSQSVDVNKNVFEGFITGVAETIKKELGEKTIGTPISAENVEQEHNPQEDSFVKFVSTLASTISANKNKPVEPVSTEENEETPIELSPQKQEEDSFGKFLGNLKDIIQKAPAEKSKEKAKKNIDKKQNKSDDYVSELKKENEPVKPKTKDELIKDLVRRFVENEIKNFKDEVTLKINQVGSSYGGGGGSNAVQYANGGTMNGDLNVNGHILSGGKDISDYFGGGGGGGNQTLSFNNNNYDLSISGGNTVNLATLKDNLSEIISTSAKWNTAYTNLVNNSAAYLLSGTNIDLGQIPVLSSSWNSVYNNVNSNSASWNSVYTTTNTNSSKWDSSYTTVNNNSSTWDSNYTTVKDNSAYWVDTRYDVTFAQNVTINGNLTAKGTATFANTIFTTTSALSVINTGPGPALYVFQSSGPSDVASFYDGDGVEVLHVGNANVGQGGKVGINESYPTTELTVRGSISASDNIIGNKIGINTSLPLYRELTVGGVIGLSGSFTPAYMGQLQIVNPGTGGAGITFAQNATLLPINGDIETPSTNAIWHAGVGIYNSSGDAAFSIANWYSHDNGAPNAFTITVPIPIPPQYNDIPYAWIGINTNEPTVELTVNGQISSNNIIYAENVSINAGSPAAQLHVKGSSNNINTPIAIIESAGNHAPCTFRVNNIDQAYVQGDYAGNLALGAQNFIAIEAGGFGDGAEKMRIQADGKVGIGTSNLSAVLTIAKEGGASVPNSDSNAILVLDSASNAANFWFNTNFDADNATLGFTNNGNYYHGITYVVQENRLTITSDGTAASPNDGLTVDGSNKVGIGTTTPSTKLDVDGVITATGGNSNLWNSAYTNLTNNSAAYLSGVNISLLTTTSGSWNSNYNTTNSNSARWSSVYTSFNNNSARYTTLDYLSTNNVLLSAATITQNLSVGGTIFSTVTANVMGSYNVTIGDGINSSFNVTHNFNTTNISVAVFDLTTNTQSYPKIVITNNNTINVQFSIVPASNSFNVIVFAAVPSNRVAAYAGYTGTVTRQYDFVVVGSNSYSYCGTAPNGTATNQSSWTIKRLYFSTAGTLLSSGTVTNSVWNSRYSYNY